MSIHYPDKDKVTPYLNEDIIMPDPVKNTLEKLGEFEIKEN